MIRRLWVYAGILCCIISSALVTAQPQKFRVALSNDTYPYMFIDEQGQPDGLIVDYWRAIAQEQQFEIDFVMVPWPESVEMLNQGKVDFHGGMAYTDQRAKDYQLHSINITIYSNVFVHRDLLRVEKLSDIAPYVIGVVENSSHISTLARELPNALLRSYPTVSQMYDAALAGDLKTFTSLDRLPPRYSGYNALVNQFPLYKKVPLQLIDLSYALPLKSPLNSKLVQYTAAVSTNTLNQLERKWLGFNVANDNTLLLGLSVLNQPYMHVTSQGEATGLLVDLWRLWSEKTGTSIAFVPDNSADSLTSLTNKRIDAHIGFPDNTLLNPQLEKAYHLYSFSSAYYTLKNNDLPLPNASFTGKVGIYYNSGYLPELQQQYPDVTFIRFSSLEAMTSATIGGEIDGFFGAEAILDARLNHLDLASEFIAAPTTRLFAPLYALTHIDNSELAIKIKNGFNQMSLEELATIEKKWVSSAEQSYYADFKNKIPLTPEEKAWLLEHSPLRVGLMRNWPPMEFVDEQGNAAGVTQEILQILGERLDIEFEIMLYDNFDDILNDLEHRKLDLVANISPTAERETFVRFTEPFWSVQWALISHINSENITSAAELSGNSVAIFGDYQLASHLSDVVADTEVIIVNQLRDGIELLQNNRIDFVLDSVAAGSRELKRLNAVNLRMQVIDDLPDFPSLVGVRSDYQPLVAILNKGLRSISEAERAQMYQHWFDVEITQGVDSKKVQLIIWRIAAITVVLITVFTIWNLFLRREVNLRRQAEHKMRHMATHDDLTGLPNRSLLKERIDQAVEQHSRHNEILAVLFIDLDGFKEVNDQYGHDAGDELLLKLGGVLDSCIRKSDTVARFGGDEFVVLLTALLHPDDAAIVAEKIVFQLSQPLQLSFAQIQVGASIGIAIYPHDATDSSALLKQADKQMYLAK